MPRGELAVDIVLSLVRLGAPGRPGSASVLMDEETLVVRSLSSAERDELDQQARMGSKCACRDRTCRAAWWVPGQQ